MMIDDATRCGSGEKRREKKILQQREAAAFSPPSYLFNRGVLKDMVWIKKIMPIQQ